MSEAAIRERVRKQGWAAPGGVHDGLVRILKIALPAAIGVLMAFLALAPLNRGREISFLLDKNKVELTRERLRVTQARYRGQDDRGRPFLLSAENAAQMSGGDPVVTIQNIQAQMRLDTGLATVTAPAARYDLEAETIAMSGPVRFQDAQGYRLAAGASVLNVGSQVLTTREPATLVAPDGRRVETRSAVVNLNNRRIASDQPVLFVAPDGYRLRTSNAAVDIDQRRMVSDRPINGQMPLGTFSADRMQVDMNDRKVVLQGRARLHIEQGKLK
ncbi:MAG TPA: LPS export ABC transporter periplasmic protein LptC [Allosphingosinicella sp.]|jgi:lipopolysaccharide export system protein LptC|uniref:LPS export ABC transporter periplasmic protein LptC n=1 Tax=Allosphingosinicella sp. TaxID=2823234 RepID=UPI002F28009C